MRLTSSRSVAALLLVGLVSTGCGGGSEPEETPTGTDSPSSPSSPTEEQTGTADGPVPGAGADTDPSDAEAWCGAVSAQQLAAASGWEVEAIDSYGSGIGTCSASLPGNEVSVTWGSEETSKSFDRYAAGFDTPPGTYEVTDVDLGGQPALVVLQPKATAAFAGTVEDGRLTEVRLIGLVDQDADPAELGEVARQVLAVYAD
jgi:hypothetical protein